MFNDDNWIDPRKIEANKELILEIQKYEKEHSVKLIDSIGTQMHIDNDSSKTDIENMIRELSKFGLPIEITEFDIAMTKGVSGLSDFEIEILRQQKINEVYSVVEELREECNIRGFTIWSKTDRQNFRVSLENERRIKEGEPTIESLHGGVFTENMEPKSKTYKFLLKNDFQTFNYHTHTNRCGHAGISEDREYVERARANGITQLGFSDHVPVPELAYQDSKHQMHISEVDEYVESIRNLQAENPDMKINVGFEVEFEPMKEQFFGELREKVDYMILGQHFVPSSNGLVKKDNNPDYPIKYANMLCKAMESGIFDIVAHPDIFMEYRDSLTSEEAKRQFDDNAVVASQMICNKAKEIGIPIELNFAGIDKGQIMSDGKYSYPHPTFWKIASETGVQVLYGVDAHDPSQFDKMGWNKKIADQIIDPEKLNIVSPNYNPVEARKNNSRLQELYTKGQQLATTYETNLTQLLVFRMLSGFPETTRMDELLPGEVDQMFENVSELMNKEAKAEKIKISMEKKSAEPAAEQEFQSKRTEQILQHIEETHINRQNVLDRTKQALQYSIEIGCKSKHDVISTVSKITEANSTKKESTQEKLIASIEQTKQISQEKQQHDNSKGNNTATNNNGFTNTNSLILIITFICGIIICIGYIVYKNTLLGG